MRKTRLKIIFSFYSLSLSLSLACISPKLFTKFLPHAIYVEILVEVRRIGGDKEEDKTKKRKKKKKERCEREKQYTRTIGDVLRNLRN